VPALAQVRDHRQAIGVRLVLIELALAFNALHFDLDTDDSRYHLVQVFTRRIAHLPGLDLLGLLVASQQGQGATQELFFRHHAHGAMHMHHLIVPCGNLAMRLVLGRIPVGRNVAFCPPEDHHDRRSAGATLPHRIGAGHMSGQQPVCSVAGIEFEGNVVRIHAGFTLSHEDAQRIVADNSVQLFRAVRMPRVSLLLADDVGLGKTVEAGLILAELIRKRRIRRVLIITPAALRTQWQQEMEEKFSLGFDIVDKAATHKLQKEMGLDANPWRALPRIITSYHYLRQPDVLEQFIANCESIKQRGGAQLPWDLLIVDEAHNLMPSNFGEDSDLAKMLRILTPYFEHRLFLTATPHNGHTRCFSGLLEQLDPVRFTQTPDFTDKERKMIGDVLIRRLKSEINDQDRQAGRVPRFAKRYLERATHLAE
jgi:hypothetical protein